MVDHPTPGLILQKCTRKRNFLDSPTSCVPDQVFFFWPTQFGKVIKIPNYRETLIAFSKRMELSKIMNNRKKEKMKRIFTFTIILMALTACTALQVQTPEPAATDMPQANMPNPASVYCEQNGNKLEIHTAADGSQNGICVFPDGSTCDEWAYFRGECGPAAQKSPTPAMTVEATTEASGGDTEKMPRWLHAARYFRSNS